MFSFSFSLLLLLLLCERKAARLHLELQLELELEFNCERLRAEGGAELSPRESRRPARASTLWRAQPHGRDAPARLIGRRLAHMYCVVANAVAVGRALCLAVDRSQSVYVRDETGQQLARPNSAQLGLAALRRRLHWQVNLGH